MFSEIGLFGFHAQQRARFSSGELWSDWAKQYPELFDEMDVAIVRSQAHLGFHFYEWLAAVLLYHTTGYLSLVEQYEFKKHNRKQNILRGLVSPALFELITDHSLLFGKVQCPDLLVYAPDCSDWFFCEVKGPNDNLRSKPRLLFEALAQASEGPIRLIRFREMA